MMLSHILLGASPPTGDSFPTWPLLIFILAALGIATFVIFKKQSKKVAADFVPVDFETDIPDADTGTVLQAEVIDYMQTPIIDDHDMNGKDDYSDEFESTYKNEQFDIESENTDEEED